MVTMTIYDFDGGAANEYEEKFPSVTDFAYYKTPLLPSSGNSVGSLVAVNQMQKTFTSTSAGNSSNNPDDLKPHGRASSTRSATLL